MCSSGMVLRAGIIGEGDHFLTPSFSVFGNQDVLKFRSLDI
jgi:hypothetical protein